MRPRFTIGPPRFGRGKQTSVDALSGTSGSFNGATAFQPWKVASWTRRSTRSTCFNGATAFQPWKARQGWDRASPARCFNGATAFQPWKAEDSILDSPIKEMLQWGHGVSAVERSWRQARMLTDVVLQWGHGVSAVERTDRC